jgi:hypothetical protein
VGRGPGSVESPSFGNGEDAIPAKAAIEAAIEEDGRVLQQGPGNPFPKEDEKAIMFIKNPALILS